jgi:hypothetical protein
MGLAWTVRSLTKEIVPLPHPLHPANTFSIAYVLVRQVLQTQAGNGSKQFDRLTMESSAAKPATCSTREHLQRAVEASRAEYERHSTLLRGEANYASMRSQADEARLKWQAARLALARHIVEHGCSKPSKASRWKYL